MRCWGVSSSSRNKRLLFELRVGCKDKCGQKFMNCADNAKGAQKKTCIYSCVTLKKLITRTYIDKHTEHNPISCSLINATLQILTRFRQYVSSIPSTVQKASKYSTLSVSQQITIVFQLVSKVGLPAACIFYQQLAGTLPHTGYNMTL